MKIKDFRGLFETGLRYAYDCEQRLLKKGIPKMIESSASPELRSALGQHLEETRSHAVRLERIFGMIGSEPKTEDNGIVGEILDATERMVSATEERSPLRDAALIIGGNLVEHYEIAAYGSLVAVANHLGLREAATLLGHTLHEEKAADAKLTQIGETSVNRQAAQELKAA
jgi:ferritin-like metal-binding protein YciE